MPANPPKSQRVYRLPGNPQPKQCECGRTIIFAIADDGTQLPLVACDHVYLRDYRQPGTPLKRLKKDLAYISHYIDCPLRDQFHKGERGERGKRGER